MGLFTKKKEKTEEIENPYGRKFISFSELEKKGYSLSMLGYTPSTGEVMVNVNRVGVEGEVAFGHTYISEKSGIKISNVYGAHECTGELSDIQLTYCRGDLRCTHEQVEMVIPLKKLLDEKGIQYRNDPPLEKLKEKLDRETGNLMARLRE